ncbi:MAG: biotin/lipoyl-binding protein [Candidatus Solibacter usitatus]|nr:biotin/lipoyl-binding protein [Candidatus Solibacter usitatus]
MRGKWVLLLGILVLAVIGGTALSVLLRKPPPVKKPQETFNAIPAVDEISSMGRIQAAHVVSVAALVDGIIDRWEVEAGQDVLEGQLLGHVSNTNLESDREQAQMDLDRVESKITSIEGQILAARLEAARADAESVRAKAETARVERIYLRQQMLLKEGATPRLVFEKAESEYKASKEDSNAAAGLARTTADRVARMESELAAAKKSLEDKQTALEEAKEGLEASNIVSPVDGAIIKLGAPLGGEVESANPDFIQIAVDPAILEIVIEPDPKIINRLRPGQPALVVVPEVSSEGMQGEVKEIKEKQVIIEFTSPNPQIKHGMTGSVRVKLT